LTVDLRDATAMGYSVSRDEARRYTKFVV